MSASVDTLLAQLRSDFEESIAAKRRLVDDGLEPLLTIAQALIVALRSNRKVLLFGNGGSAADAQHIAAELVSKFRRVRRALPAIALTTDSSILTSVGNDFSFDEIFARQIEALGVPGDVAIGLSTSGNSPNVLRGLSVAHELGLVTVGLTGLDGGRLKALVQHCFLAPSLSTPRIQELHITAAHAICEAVELSFVED